MKKIASTALVLVFGFMAVFSVALADYETTGEIKVAAKALGTDGRYKKIGKVKVYLLDDKKNVVKKSGKTSSKGVKTFPTF
ncbi:MAG TPA: hypothetical protein DIT25_01935 [Candidatus Moranbacteria bacterium]|nr:hypothetical protein [Candidatus Moranbacteria bacterium]